MSLQESLKPVDGFTFPTHPRKKSGREEDDIRAVGQQLTCLLPVMQGSTAFPHPGLIRMGEVEVRFTVGRTSLKARCPQFNGLLIIADHGVGMRRNVEIPQSIGGQFRGSIEVLERPGHVATLEVRPSQVEPSPVLAWLQFDSLFEPINGLRFSTQGPEGDGEVVEVYPIPWRPRSDSLIPPYGSIVVAQGS